MPGPRAPAFSLILLLAACGGRAVRSGAEDGADAEPATPQPGSSNPPGIRNLAGEYELVTSGSRTPCASPGQEAPVALPSPTRLSVTQDPDDPGRGTVMLSGLGEPLLDDRVFDADFQGSSFHVALDGPLSQACAQHYGITLSYDFDGVGPRRLSLDFEHSPKCIGNAGGYCTGSIEGAFGEARRLRPER